MRHEPRALGATCLALLVSLGLAACADGDSRRLRAELAQLQRDHAADRARLDQLAAQNHRLTGEAANAAASCTFQIAIAVEQAASRRGTKRPAGRAAAAPRATAGARRRSQPAGAPQSYLPLKPLTPDQVRALTEGVAGGA